MRLANQLDTSFHAGEGVVNGGVTIKSSEAVWRAAPCSASARLRKVSPLLNRHTTVYPRHWRLRRERPELGSRCGMGLNEYSRDGARLGQRPCINTRRDGDRRGAGVHITVTCPTLDAPDIPPVWFGHGSRNTHHQPRRSVLATR